MNQRWLTIPSVRSQGSKGTLFADLIEYLTKSRYKMIGIRLYVSEEGWSNELWWHVFYGWNKTICISEEGYLSQLWRHVFRKYLLRSITHRGMMFIRYFVSCLHSNKTHDSYKSTDPEIFTLANRYRLYLNKHRKYYTMLMQCLVFSLIRRHAQNSRDEKNHVYLGRDTCFLSRGITGALLPPFSSRWANCFLNWSTALHIYLQ